MEFQIGGEFPTHIPSNPEVVDGNPVTNIFFALAREN